MRAIHPLFLVVILLAAPLARAGEAEGEADPTAPVRYRLELARVHLEFGEAAAARPLLEEAVDLLGELPADRQPLLARDAADLCGRAGLTARAMSLLERMGALPVGELKLALARHLAAGEDWEQALPLYDELRAEPALVWTVRREQLRLLADHDRLEATVAEAEAALAADENDVETAIRLALIFTDFRPQPAKAVRYLETAAAVRPNDRELGERLALACRRARLWDRCAAAYQRLAERFPDQAADYAWQASEAHRLNGDLAAALQWAQTAGAGAEQAPLDRVLQLAVLALQAGRPDEAQAYYRRVMGRLRQPTQGTRYMIAFARALDEADDLAESRRIFRQVLFQNHPPRETLEAGRWFIHGFHRRGQLAAGLQQLEQIVSDCRQPARQALLKEALADANLLDDDEARLAKAASLLGGLDQRQARVLTKLGQAQRRLGQLDQAAATLERAFTADTDPAVQKDLARQLVALAGERLNREDLARWSRALRERSARDPLTLLELGEQLVAGGLAAEGRETLAAVPALGRFPTEEARLRLRLAGVYRRLGLLEEAAAALRLVRETAPDPALRDEARRALEELAPPADDEAPGEGEAPPAPPGGLEVE